VSFSDSGISLKSSSNAACEIPLWGFYASAICWFADYLTMALDKYLDYGNVGE